LQINLYENDIPELLNGKNLECITRGIKNWLITINVPKETKRKYLDLKYIKNCLLFERLEIKINKDRLLELVNNSIELLGTRGKMEHLPFDRLEIHYQNLDGTNASKNLDPLTENPKLREIYFEH
jgi:hypothetical protein